MPTCRIRISESSLRILREISQRDNKPMQAVVEQAIESYRRQSFLEGLSDDFASLRQNEGQCQEEKLERSAWDCALADGNDT
jgi:hypothetical protein